MLSYNQQNCQRMWLQTGGGSESVTNCRLQNSISIHIQSMANFQVKLCQSAHLISYFKLRQHTTSDIDISTWFTSDVKVIERTQSNFPLGKFHSIFHDVQMRTRINFIDWHPLANERRSKWGILKKRCHQITEKVSIIHNWIVSWIRQSNEIRKRKRANWSPLINELFLLAFWLICRHFSVLSSNTLIYY